MKLCETEALEDRSTNQGQTDLRVLAVSNHWEVTKDCPYVSIFMDRQLSSLRNAGVIISTFDIGASHSPLKLYRKWLELRREVRRQNPNLIHSQYGTIRGLLSAFSGRPTVISFCGSDLLAGASVSKWRMRLGFLFSQLSALRARVIICKSEELRQALWWRKGRAVVIPNGVDLNLFSPGAQDKARKELGWDLHRPIVLHVAGRDPVNKGLDVAEEAMRLVRSSIPLAELHVISAVEPSRMPLYYRAADVLLCSSKAEGSPNVIKEALACNLPVVSCPVGDVPERLKGVHPSKIVPRDPKLMVAAIEEILLERKRSDGREHVKHLALNRVAMTVKKCYESVLR